MANEALSPHRDAAVFGRFRGGVSGAAGAEELVEPEGEHRAVRFGAPDRGAGQQPTPDGVLAVPPRDTGFRGQYFSSAGIALDRDWGRSHQPAVACFQSETGLDPRRQRITAHGVVVRWLRGIASDAALQGLREVRLARGVCSGASQRLRDDFGGPDFGAEQS